MSVMYWAPHCHQILSELSSFTSALGYGLPDDVVIEKQGKGDNFFDCTGANIKISNLKLVQHDAVEGILSKCESILTF